MGQRVTQRSARFGRGQEHTRGVGTQVVVHRPTRGGSGSRGGLQNPATAPACSGADTNLQVAGLLSVQRLGRGQPQGSAECANLQNSAGSFGLQKDDHSNQHANPQFNACEPWACCRCRRCRQRGCAFMLALRRPADIRCPPLNEQQCTSQRLVGQGLKLFQQAISWFAGGCAKRNNSSSHGSLEQQRRRRAVRHRWVLSSCI